MVSRYLQGKSRVILAAAMVAAIALVDWRVDAPISFGFLYLIPMLLVGAVWRRWQILGAAAVCMLLADLFDAYHFSLGRDRAAGHPGFRGAGRRRTVRLRNRPPAASGRNCIWKRWRRESAARKAAEEQLEFLIDSSPAAILTMDVDCVILRANSAAHRLLGVAAGELAGEESSTAIFPRWGACPRSTRHAADLPHRDAVPRRARNREIFLANVFFSTYQTAMGPRLAALVVDASEELRDREESSLEQCWPARGFWWAPSRTRSATCAAPSRSTMKTWCAGAP